MLKLDRIEQEVEISTGEYLVTRKNEDYTFTPTTETGGTLKTNPGKSLNEYGLNLGASPEEAKKINDYVLDELGAIVVKNKCIEYCITIPTNFKLVDNKHIIETFNLALFEHKYSSRKLDFGSKKKVKIKDSSWKGIKGYKSSRALKLYSKYEEKEIEAEGDLIRIELIFNAKALEQNKIIDITDIEKAKSELRDFLWTWERELGNKINQYSRNTKYLIEKFREGLR